MISKRNKKIADVIESKKTCLEDVWKVVEKFVIDNDKKGIANRFDAARYAMAVFFENPVKRHDDIDAVITGICFACENIVLEALSRKLKITKDDLEDMASLSTRLYPGSKLPRSLTISQCQKRYKAANKNWDKYDNLL